MRRSSPWSTLLKITGTFYHEAEESEHLEHLQPGDTIDYRSCLTRWVERIDEDEPIILKLACEQAPGLRLTDEVILGE